MAQNSFPNVTAAVSRMVSVGAIILIAVTFASCGLTTTINSGEAGVKYSIFGGTDLDFIYGEGLNVHAPWVNVIRYDIRVQEQLEEMDVLSSNGLNIGMDVSIRWRPLRTTLPQLHTTFGPEYYQKLVQPELRSAMREIVGQFTPEELYSSRRQELQGLVFDTLTSRVAQQFIEIDAIRIRDINLPDQIRTAIENKLKEEQEAERYIFTLEKERLEAERKMIEAEGQAEYQRIITASLSSNFLRYKGIEATLNLAQSENAKTVVIGSSEDGLPLILGNQ